MKQQFETLRELTSCTSTLCKLLSFIEEKMLDINPSNRVDSETVRSFLRDLRDNSRE